MLWFIRVLGRDPGTGFKFSLLCERRQGASLTLKRVELEALRLGWVGTFTPAPPGKSFSTMGRQGGLSFAVCLNVRPWAQHFAQLSLGKGFSGPDWHGEPGLMLPSVELLAPSFFQNQTKHTGSDYLSFLPLLPCWCQHIGCLFCAYDGQLSGLLPLPLASPSPHTQSVHPAAVVML